MELNNEVEKEIIELEKRLWKAQVDDNLEELNELLSDDLLFWGMDGSVESKAVDIEMHRSGALNITKLDPLEVNVYGIPGGATSLVKMYGEAFVSGEKVCAELRYTRVWARLGDSYKVVSAGITILPK